jgi:TPP-dependent 2-oxoacid decarboxylase
VKEKVESAKVIISIGSIKSDFNTGGFSYNIPTARTIEVSTIRGEALDHHSRSVSSILQTRVSALRITRVLG